MNEFEKNMTERGFKRTGHWDEFLGKHWRKENGVRLNMNPRLRWLLFKRRVLHFLLKRLHKKWAGLNRQLEGYEHIVPVPSWTFMGNNQQ